MTSRIDSKVLSNAVTTANHHFFLNRVKTEHYHAHCTATESECAPAFSAGTLVGTAVEQCCSDGRTVMAWESQVFSSPGQVGEGLRAPGYLADSTAMTTVDWSAKPHKGTRFALVPELLESRVWAMWLLGSS
jgi:hypothetical protein